MPIRNRQHDFMGYPLERLDRIVRCVLLYEVAVQASSSCCDFFCDELGM